MIRSDTCSDRKWEVAVDRLHIWNRTTRMGLSNITNFRPTFVKLLDSGEIGYEQPGRHRRVLLADVLEYRHSRSSQRRKALDRMVEVAEEGGMYDLTTGHPGPMR